MSNVKVMLSVDSDVSFYFCRTINICESHLNAITFCLRLFLLKIQLIWSLLIIPFVSPPHEVNDEVNANLYHSNVLRWLKMKRISNNNPKIIHTEKKPNKNWMKRRECHTHTYHTSPIPLCCRCFFIHHISRDLAKEY